MWFNNALIFQFDDNTTQEFADALAQNALKPCPPHSRFIYGWLPVLSDCYALEVLNASLFCLGKEERILPKAVIAKILQEKVEERELAEGKNMKRSDKSKLAEDLEFELLPKSFTVQKRLHGIIDKAKKRLILNTSSISAASTFLANLRKAFKISVAPIVIDSDLSYIFQQWILNPSSLPAHFQLASDCVLYSKDDDKKRLNCKGYELPADEILTLIDQGLVPAELSLIYKERISFTVTRDFVLKKIKCLDYLTDAFHEASKLDDEFEKMDANLTLLSGELFGLIDDLLAAFAKGNRCDVVGMQEEVALA